MAKRPDLEIVELRGNVPTRLSKVETGKVHAAILAAAGLIRLEVQQRITMFFEPPDWLPAPGQGAIAIQVRSDDERMRELLSPLDHQPTSIATRAERAFLAALEGGCQVPIGALVSAVSGRPTLYGSPPRFAHGGDRVCWWSSASSPSFPHRNQSKSVELSTISPAAPASHRRAS
jgi:hydroxymethylbilane synthase